MKTFTYTINDKPIEKIIDFSMFENEKNILIQIFCGQTVGTFMSVPCKNTFTINS